MRQLGRNIPVSLNRALVLDICAISARIPQFPVEISMPLESLAETRRRSYTRISWAALFLRAYGLVSRDEPLLRTSFLTWPWLHMVSIQIVWQW